MRGICPLTTSTNTFTGDTGDDQFDSSLAGSAGTTNTLNALDNLDGGDGNDILAVEIRTAVTPAAIDNIETISSTFSGAVTFGLSGSTGLVNLANVSSSENATFTGLAATTVNLSVVGVASNTTEFTYASTTGTQSVNLEVSSVTGAADALITIDGIETIAVTASGTSVYALAADAATTLSFAGSAAQTVTLDATTLSVSNYDGSAATGAITLTTIDQTGTAADVSVSGGSGNDKLTVSAESNDMSISGGAGKDTIVHTGVDLADTIDGGDGSDALSTDNASAFVLEAATPDTYIITNVEAITITDAFDGSLDLANIDETMNIVNLTFASAAGSLMAGGDTITGPASALTVNLGGSSLLNANVLTGALTVVDTGTATTDAVTLNNTAITLTTSLNLDVFGDEDITSTGYEKVTISSGAVSGGAEQTIDTLTITPDSTTAAVTLTVTGTNALEISNGLTTTSTGLMTVDASGMTAQTAGTTTFEISTTTHGTSGTASITGSSGDDTITVGAFASTILGGAGNDALTGGTAKDSIDGGAGIDVLVGGGGNDTILGGAGNDTITTSGTDTSVDGGAGDDTVNVTTTLSSGDTLIGGDGNDTLAITTATASGTIGARVSGFEILSTTDATAVMSRYTNNTFTTIVQAASANNGLAVTNAGSAVTQFNILDGTATLVSSFERNADGDADSLTIYAGIAVAAASALTASGEETIIIDTSDFTADLDLATATALTSLTIEGDNAAIIDAQLATDLATIDASGVTGTATLSVDASDSEVAVTFTGGTSTGTATVITGVGADKITAGSGILDITSGAGADSITGGTLADVIVSGSGADTIYGGAGADDITGGTSADTIYAGDADLAVDTISFTVATSADTVYQFETDAVEDLLDFSGFVIIPAGEAAVAAGGTVADASDAITIYVFATGATAVGGITISDYTDTADVLDYVNASLTIELLDVDSVAVINDLANDIAYVYYIDVDSVDDTDAESVTLIGTVNIDNSALTIANTVF